MGIFYKKKSSITPLVEHSIQGKLNIEVYDYAKSLDLIVDFFKIIRPSNSSDVEQANKLMYEAIAMMNEYPELNNNIKIAFLSQLINTNIVPALTQSGTLISRGFWQEFKKRINHKYLPELQSEKDFLYVINRIFYKRGDYIWVENITVDSWSQFFATVGIETSHSNVALKRQLLAAMEILSYRVVSQSTDKDMIRYMPSNYLHNNPFLLQNEYLLKLREIYFSDNDNEYLKELAIFRLNESINNSVKVLDEIREAQRTHGASLSLTYTTLVLESSLKRMRILFDAIDNDHEINIYRFVNFFKELVRNEKRKNSIRELMSNSFGYVAYQIAEHKGTKGTKYITSTWKEYIKMLISAMWGGFIICFVGLIKNILTLFHLHPFILGIGNSLNYSAGFVMIEETHSSLATKQPAFTASAVASSFDEKKNGRPNLYALAVTVGKIIRSQAASFIGNLIVVFPGTYFFAYLYDKIMGYKLVSGAAAYELLESQHPFHSFSLLYACNTGFFLFLSGIIAGYVQNGLQFNNVGLRIKEHPLLRNIVSKERLGRWGFYIQSHLGGIIGNIALGFFLGMSSIVPKLTGLNFDIRHITISSANVSIGAYGLGLSNLTWDYLLTIIIGVLGIGFFNFAVSFTLAFIVAVRSRNIKMKDYPEFLRILSKYFIKYPLNFIVPPSKRKSVNIKFKNMTESNQE